MCVCAGVGGDAGGTGGLSAMGSLQHLLYTGQPVCLPVRLSCLSVQACITQSDLCVKVLSVWQVYVLYEACQDLSV